MREVEVITIPKPKRHPAFSKPGYLPIMEPSLVQPSQLKGKTCLYKSEKSPCCWLAGNPSLPKTRRCEWHAETLGYVNGRPAKGDECLAEGAEDMPAEEFEASNREFVAKQARS
jgi:hypothetical protein